MISCKQCPLVATLMSVNVWRVRLKNNDNPLFICWPQWSSEEISSLSQILLNFFHPRLMWQVWRVEMHHFNCSVASRSFSAHSLWLMGSVFLFSTLYFLSLIHCPCLAVFFSFLFPPWLSVSVAPPPPPMPQLTPQIPLTGFVARMQESSKWRGHTQVTSFLTRSENIQHALFFATF